MYAVDGDKALGSHNVGWDLLSTLDDHCCFRCTEIPCFESAACLTCLTAMAKGVIPEKGFQQGICAYLFRCCFPRL